MRIRRRAARVAVVAPDWAVHLFHYDNPEVGEHWALPDGGLEPGESPREGALRELREETGWTDLEPAGPLCLWEHDFTRADVRVRQHEHVYLAYGPRRDPQGDLSAAHAADRIEYGRWWPPAELAATDDALWPPRSRNCWPPYGNGGCPSSRWTWGSWRPGAERRRLRGRRHSARSPASRPPPPRSSRSMEESTRRAFPGPLSWCAVSS
ncbi:NUDIX domain-containing protein [Streptomyces sp. NPDC049954]|uniref:NUDIX domain-containing protein n=1 Tax=Streptomyces sp. NPDC049954 TaxID=3155779 RepID=UPI00341A259C